MRINGRGAVMQLGSISGSGGFAASWNDVADSRAGTVRHALVTNDELGVAQGQTNACGPVSLWLALGQFGRATQTWQQLDAEVRPWNLGSSAGVLAEAARERGLQAQVYNRGSFFDLERETQSGRAVLVMTDVGGYDRAGGDMLPGSPADFDSHWMRVTRAWEDSSGKRWVEYENPWGTRELLRFEQFDALWKDQRLGGLSTGYDRAYVLIDRARARPLPPTTAHDVAAVMTTSDGAQTFARGISSLAKGNVARGLGQVLGGGVMGVCGLVGTVAAVPGTWLQQGGAALFEVAQRGFAEGGLAAVGGALAAAAGAVSTGVGLALSAVGNAMGVIGQAVGAMVQGAFSGLARLFG